MTAKEKANELVNKFYCSRVLDFNAAKQCALIAVNEIILSNPHSNPFNTDVYSTMDYWLSVKSELNAL